MRSVDTPPDDPFSLPLGLLPLMGLLTLQLVGSGPGYDIRGVLRSARVHPLMVRWRRHNFAQAKRAAKAALSSLILDLLLARVVIYESSRLFTAILL